MRAPTQAAAGVRSILQGAGCEKEGRPRRPGDYLSENRLLTRKGMCFTLVANPHAIVLVVHPSDTVRGDSNPGTILRRRGLSSTRLARLRGSPLPREMVN
jgi:hypothetical protein